MGLFDRVDENSCDLRRAWDERSMNDLRRMWPNPAHSARTIAKLLGFSRNAIIAKAHRMGLAKNGKKATTYARTRSPRNPNPPKPRLSQLWRALPFRDTGAAGRKPLIHPCDEGSLIHPSDTSRPGSPKIGANRLYPAPPPPKPLPQSHNAPPSPANVSMCDLRAGQCRWPMWDQTCTTGLFCGAETVELLLPYCAGHCALAYQPRKGRRLEAAE